MRGCAIKQHSNLEGAMLRLNYSLNLIAYSCYLFVHYKKVTRIDFVDSG